MARGTNAHADTNAAVALLDEDAAIAPSRATVMAGVRVEVMNSSLRAGKSMVTDEHIERESQRMRELRRLAGVPAMAPTRRKADCWLPSWV